MVFENSEHFTKTQWKINGNKETVTEKHEREKTYLNL